MMMAASGAKRCCSCCWRCGSGGCPCCGCCGCCCCCCCCDRGVHKCCTAAATRTPTSLSSRGSGLHMHMRGGAGERGCGGGGSSGVAQRRARGQRRTQNYNAVITDNAHVLVICRFNNRDTLSLWNAKERGVTTLKRSAESARGRLTMAAAPRPRTLPTNTNPHHEIS